MRVPCRFAIDPSRVEQTERRAGSAGAIEEAWSIPMAAIRPRTLRTLSTALD